MARVSRSALGLLAAAGCAAQVDAHGSSVTVGDEPTVSPTPPPAQAGSNTASGRSPPAEPAPVLAAASGGASPGQNVSELDEVSIAPLGPEQPATTGVHVEVLFPYLGNTIPQAKVDEAPVRWKLENLARTPASADHAEVVLALDDYTPRRVSELGSPVHLGDLVPAGQRLPEGVHRLVAVAMDDRGVSIKPSHPASRGPFSAVTFRVGVRAPIPADEPWLLCLRPRRGLGRQSGASGFVLDFYVVGAAIGADSYHVEWTLEGPGLKRTRRIDRWEALSVSNLRPGQYSIELRLLDPAGQDVDGAQARCSATVDVKPTEEATG